MNELWCFLVRNLPHGCHCKVTYSRFPCPSSLGKPERYIASFAASEIAIYSASVDERVTVFCFREPQVTDAPERRKIYPTVTPVRVCESSNRKVVYREYQTSISCDLEITKHSFRSMPMFPSIAAIEFTQSTNCVHDVKSGASYKIHESTHQFTKRVVLLVLTTRSTGFLDHVVAQFERCRHALAVPHSVVCQHFFNVSFPGQRNFSSTSMNLDP